MKRLIEKRRSQAMFIGKERWIMGTIFFLLVIASSSFTADGDVINAAPYLRENTGARDARSLAMGSVSAAIVSDANATVWNVAGLSRVRSTSLAATLYSGDVLDRKHRFLALAQTLKGVGTFGLAWINSGVEGIERYSASNQREGTFDSSENAFLLSYGTAFHPIRLGWGIKILSQSIDPESDPDMGFGGLDIGVILEPVEAVTFGLTIQNIRGKIADASVPIQLRLGVALKLLPEKNLLLVADMDKTFVDLEGETYDLHTGVEYWVTELIGFRFGVTSEKEISAGIGVSVPDVSVDCAYSIERSDGLEPDTHSLGIGISMSGISVDCVFRVGREVYTQYISVSNRMVITERYNNNFSICVSF